MDANTNITLEVIYAAIEADIKARFPALVTVKFDHEDRKTLPAPACLLTLVEFEASPDNDPGTEQLCVLASFEAELIIKFNSSINAKKNIRTLAANMAAWLHNRRWNMPGYTGEPGRAGSKLPTGPCMVGGAYPDDFQPELDQFEIWRVEWSQLIHLGDTVWTNEGVTPSQVFLGQAPEIGTGNEGDYTEVTK